MRRSKKTIARAALLGCAGIAFLMAGCSRSAQEAIPEEVEEDTVHSPESGENDDVVQESESSGTEGEGIEGNTQENDERLLEEIASMPGMKDEETAELFGGGEENWTEDGEFYIGRIYQVQLYENPCQVFTTCRDDGTVESVSVWIVGGERDVTEEEVQLWKERVSSLMGTEPSTSEEPSEGGSIHSRWTANGMAAAMYQMKDILTVSFQPAVGELK